MSVESSEESMRDMGRLGAHIAGHYWLLGSSHYVWYDQGDGCFDPGSFDTSLSGRTGISVSLTASNRTAAQVATATASAITTEGTYSASADGADVTVTGTDTASAGTRDWDTSEAGGDHGLSGCQYYRLSNEFPNPSTISFANGAFSAAQINSAAFPSENVVITGFRVSIGDVHADQLTVAIYQGGSSDTDCSGATQIGVVGTTSGSGLNQEVFVPCPAPFELDPTAGRIWIAWMHASGGGGFQALYPYDTGNPEQNEAITTSDYVIGAGNYIREMSGTTMTSDPNDFPATLGSVTNSTTAIPSLAVSYVSSAGFQNDMTVTGRFGTRAAAASLTGTSTFTLLVGNSFTSPATAGMTVRDAGVAYVAHASGNDYRLSFATGGTADDNFSGAAFYDIGAAGGTDTGWVTVTAPAGIAIPASTRVWVMIHHTAGSSSLAFDSGAPDAYGPDANPAAYYNGNTSESEADDGTLGGTASTNVEFDSANAQVSPDGTTLTPDGTIYTNDNNVGVCMTYEVLGFAVAA